MVIDNYNGSGNQTGKTVTTNCDTNAPGQEFNVGCGVLDDESVGSYGDGLNNQKGGVFATHFDADGVIIWFFPRSQIPKDIQDGNPMPHTWPVPNARFQSEKSDWLAHFRKLRVIFNITFCGSWAGSVWNNNPECKAKAPTCHEYVANNPEAFKDVYWRIRGLQVYRKV